MKIDSLPFYYKSLDKKDSTYPELLPFNLMFDKELKMYRQIVSDGLREILESVYKAGTLVEGSLSNESGNVYLEKILNYLDENLILYGKNLLEIGCGDGTMLEEFQKRGASVLGLEPGAHSLKIFERPIEIIKDFFPSNRIVGRFDIIFSYGVLEHIENPVQFIVDQKQYLKRDGKIIICVPNTESCVKTGDISMFIHEHFNYFTSESLVLTVSKAGLNVESIIEIEGVLMAILSEDTKNTYSTTFQINQKYFENEVDNLKVKLSLFLSAYEESQIAVYPAMRALNYLAILKMKDCRLIDDNSQLYNKYMPYTNRTIENFQKLVDNPPKVIVIFSRTFGKKIKDKCMSQPELNKVKIITLDEL